MTMSITCLSVAISASKQGARRALRTMLQARKSKDPDGRQSNSQFALTWGIGTAFWGMAFEVIAQLGLLIFYVG